MRKLFRRPRIKVQMFCPNHPRQAVCSYDPKLGTQSYSCDRCSFLVILSNEDRKGYIFF